MEQSFMVVFNGSGCAPAGDGDRTAARNSKYGRTRRMMSSTAGEHAAVSVLQGVATLWWNQTTAGRKRHPVLSFRSAGGANGLGSFSFAPDP